MDQRVEKVIDLMEASLDRQLSLDELARRVNLSPSRLSHLFAIELGMAPAAYFKQLKLREAKLLLETTFLTVQQIMQRVAMPDPSHFARDFKRAYSSTPQHHRECSFRHHLIVKAPIEGVVAGFANK